MSGPQAIGAGVHWLDAATYHADPCPAPSLSSTLARLLLDRSPRHAWHASPRLNPMWEPTEKAVFDIGRAAHREILGAGSDYTVIPPDLLSANGAASTKAAREFIEDARERGLTPIKEEVSKQVAAMADALRAGMADRRIAPFDPGRSEITVTAEIDGVWCRAMIDNAPADPGAALYDLKTTEDASPDALVRSVVRYGYDVQARWYQDVWRAATGESRPFRFVFVEKSEPHEIAVVQLHDDPDSDADWMLDAASKCAEARRIWRECLEADRWPGYPPQIAVLGAPTYHRTRWADREIGRPVNPKPSRAALDAARKAQAPERIDA